MLSFQVKNKNSPNSKSDGNFESLSRSQPVVGNASQSMTNTTNNYEILEYEHAGQLNGTNRSRQVNHQTIPSQHANPSNIATIEYDANTIDVYSYRDCNVVYEEKPAVNYDEKPAVPQQVEHLILNQVTQRIEPGPMILGEVKPMHTYDTTSNYRAPPNNYNFQNIKYLIDINDLKTHLTSNYDNSQSKSSTVTTLDPAKCSAVTQNQYEMSSQSHLLKLNQSEHSTNPGLGN